MPAIKEYRSTGAEQGLGPGIRTTNAGADAVASASRRLSSFAYEDSQRVSRAAANEGHALGDLGQGLQQIGQSVQKYQEHRELMDFHAHEAQFTNEMTQAWNAMRTNADPNDPAVAARFNEEVYKPALEKFSERFTSDRGQEMVAGYGARLQDHLFTRQAADAAVAAGEAVVKNLNTVSNNNAATLVSDPSALDFVNANTQAMIANYKKSNPNLTTEQVAHIDELGTKMLHDNTIAAFHGMASKNPAAAGAALEGGYGGDTLSATDRAQMANYARAQENITKEQARAAKVEARQTEQDAANTDANKLFAAHIDPTTGTFNAGPDYFQGIRDFVDKHPNEQTGLPRAMFSAGQAAVQAELTHKYQQTDPATFSDMMSRATLPPNDPRALTSTDVLTAFADNKLSKADNGLFLKYADELRKDPVKRDAYSQFNKFLASQKTSITKSSPALGVFPQQDQRYGQFQFDMRQQFDQAYAAGKWQDALNPNSQTFLGKQTPTYSYNTKAGLGVYQKNLLEGVGVAEPVPAGTPAPTAQKQSVDAARAFLAGQGKN